jgi:hypothetical protein
MKILDVAHNYVVNGNQEIKFIKRIGGELVQVGTTNEELLEVLIDRTEQLEASFPCDENKVALLFMREALRSFNIRTSKRLAQGVETKDIAHVS